MPKLKRILAMAGRGLRRFVALGLVVLLALTMLIISLIAGATADDKTGDVVATALRTRWEPPSQIPDLLASWSRCSRSPSQDSWRNMA